MISLIAIKNFLFSKLGLYAIAVIAIIFSLYFTYQHIYNKGYEKAKEEYKEELVVQLAKQQKTYEITVQKAEVSIKQEEKIRTVYEDRIIEVEKISQKQIYKEKVLEDEDYEVFRKSQEDVK